MSEIGKAPAEIVANLRHEARFVDVATAMNDEVTIEYARMCTGAADCIEALTAERDALKAENERLREVAHELSKALTQVRPLGGSELFKRFDDQTYFAEPAYCAAAINALRDENHQFRKEEARRRLSASKPPVTP